MQNDKTYPGDVNGIWEEAVNGSDVTFGSSVVITVVNVIGSAVVFVSAAVVAVVFGSAVVILPALEHNFFDLRENPYNKPITERKS